MSKPGELSKPHHARAHARLLHRIHRLGYETAENSLQLGRHTFRFVHIADPDKVLDRVAEEEDRLEKLNGKRTPGDQLHLPYWAELWDSGLAVAGHLLDRANDLKGRLALDLGCGMGLAGTVAARLGMRVVFADREPPALLFARLNSLADASRIRARQLNWRTDHLRERFDIILGADILYEREQWDFLEPFWREHLRPGGTVLLGEPGRQTGDAFPDWLAARSRGWTLTRHIRSVPTRPVPIRLFELRRRAAE